MKKNSVPFPRDKMAHSGPKKAPQTRPGSLFPKIVVLGWQEVKSQFWSVFGLHFVFVLHDVFWL